MRQSLCSRLAVLLLFVIGTASVHGIIFTNNAHIGFLDTTFEGQQIVVSNSTLTIDGEHTFLSLQILEGGVVKHSSSNSGTVTNTIQIMDEVHTLEGTTFAYLAYTNIVPGSFTVSNLDGTIRYAPDTDYTILYGNPARFSRMTGGAIADGASISASYVAVLATGSAGMFLTISNDLEIAAGSAINVSGLGFGGNVGAGVGQSKSTNAPTSFTAGGGAGHGAFGGNSITAVGGVSYGSVTNPMTLGSGGGAGASVGGAGGGAVRIVVGGVLHLHGAIKADGSNGTNSNSGGGAGGSLWIDANRIEGSGVISAVGGSGEPYNGGGGSGGRIAIYCEENAFAGSISARGGSGWMAGGAGTVFLKQSTDDPTLLLDNGGLNGANSGTNQIDEVNLVLRNAATLTVSNLTVRNLTIESNAWLSAVSNVNLAINVAGDLHIHPGGRINADERGYSSNQGPGAGASTASGSAGGGHGGMGGKGGTSGASYGGNAVGAIINPQERGSGGGTGGGLLNGGTGGGGISISVSGTARIDGRISANGGSAFTAGSGGGAGGFIRISASTLLGSGNITAAGGDGDLPMGGGGGGGRILISSRTNSFVGMVGAPGGMGWLNGGAGTVFLNDPFGVTGSGTILIDNAGLSGGTTPLTGVMTGKPNLIVQNCAIATSNSVSGNAVSIDLGAIAIRSNSSFIVSRANISSSNTVVEATGRISADGLGSSIVSFPSLAQTIGGYGAGGGHGGYGGQSSTRAAGGVAFGNFSAPADIGGAGAGTSSFGGNPGGPGGGAIKLTVTEVLAVDGEITADGSAASIANTGGGAGGSVYLVAGRFAGTGSISARGGSGFVAELNKIGGGGGGGGRIAAYFDQNDFSGQMIAAGGRGAEVGGAGTVFTKNNNEQFSSLIMDNAGEAGASTPVAISFSPDVVIRNGATVIKTNTTTATMRSLFIGSNSWLLGLSPTVTKDVIIEAGGGVSFDGMSSSSIGAGTSQSGFGGGGGHGGSGGNGTSGNVGGASHGSITQPTALGGRGGNGLNNLAGGFGGGALLLNVNGTLDLNGIIRANGSIGGTNAGGGSGGSIQITAATLSGAGLIEANGGDAGVIFGTGRGGGGGGGRIAVYYTTNLFTGRYLARGGLGANNGGAGTVFIQQSGVGSGQVIVDNDGTPGSPTVMSFVGADLVIGDGAVVGFATSFTVPALHIRSNGVLTTAITNNATLNFNVTKDLIIDPGGQISMKGRGYTGATPTGRGGSSVFNGTNTFGGGGHGGTGGYAEYGTNRVSGGAAHGSIAQPNSFGGAAGGYNQTGAPGGGAIQINVARQLLLNGSIDANGADGVSLSGGGAGGSINLSVGQISGTGQILANGGNPSSSLSGGGGGGRIALAYNLNSFGGRVSAFGAPGSSHGGAGTILLRANHPASVSSHLIVANNGVLGGSTPLNVASAQPYNVVITNAAIGTFPGGPITLKELVVTSNSFVRPTSSTVDLTAESVIVDENAAFEFDNVSASGSGSVTGLAGGGGHGGMGGLGTNSIVGNAHDSFLEPISSGGSAGTISIIGPFIGSRGGGALRMTVTRKLQLNGGINADGGSGFATGHGGAAGGSVWLTVGDFAGSGRITANGGSGKAMTTGGGGGGRIAIYYETNNFSGSISASGGDGLTAGGAGTVYLRSTTTNDPGNLLINNAGIAGAYTPLSLNATAVGPNLFVGNGAILLPAGELALSSLTLLTNSSIFHANLAQNLSLVVMNDALIAGNIVVDGRGFGRTNAGPGAGLFSGRGSGGGHGGAGGQGGGSVIGGGIYGSATAPKDFGSRGGVPATTGEYSSGGGAIRLQVGGMLDLAGNLTANGSHGVLEHSGGGAGGSIWITATRLAGAGSIVADGGDGEPSEGGGGGGGRIAVYTRTNTFTGVVSAVGGLGWENGKPGSVIYSSAMGTSVVAQTPTGTNAMAVSQINLTFDSALQFGSVTTSDFSILTPSGPISPSSVTINGSSGVTLHIPVLTEIGPYQVQAGPHIENIYGESMSGPYTGEFTIAPLFISGTVIDTNNLPIPDALILAGSEWSVNADSNGVYRLTVPPSWSGSVSASHPGLTFVPGSRVYTNLLASTAGANFMAIETELLKVSNTRIGTNLLLTMQGIAGFTYQPFYSSNLLTWVPYGTPITGSNELISLNVVWTNSPGGFFQIRLDHD